jgi:hypothetical protein
MSLSFLRSPSRRLFVAASGWAAVGGHAVLNVRHVPAHTLALPAASSSFLHPDTRFRLRPAIAGLRRNTGGDVPRRLPAAPAPGCSESGSGRARRRRTRRISRSQTGAETAKRTPHRSALRRYRTGEDPRHFPSAVSLRRPFASACPPCRSTLMLRTHTSRVTLRLCQCAAIAVCRMPPSKTPASSAQPA